MANLTGDALVQDNQRRAAELGVQISGVGGAPYGTALNSSTLRPQTPAQVTQPIPSIQGAGLGGLIQGSVIDPYNANLQAQADPTAYTNSRDALTQAMNSFMGSSELADKAYAKTVDPAQKELADITNQITAEQTANRHQIEALKNAPQGFIGQGLQNRVNDLNTSSLLRQADLSVIQLAKQGAYDSAKAIADRAVDVAVEQQKNKIAALQLTYEDNKDLFTKAEQRAFESAQADRNRTLDEQTYEQRAKYDQLLKQSDPLYIEQLTAARNQNNLGGGGFDTGPVNTVQTSDGTQAVSTYTLNAGDDPYNIAQENGTDMATLQKLNPNVTDWHNLPVGTVLNLPDSGSAWLNGKTTEQVAAYNNIPAADKASVQQLITGDALLSDLVKSRGASGTADIARLTAEAQKIDPTFSVNTNKVRYNFLQNWNNPNGASSKVRNSINTALGHLADFKQNADALDPGTLRSLNSVSNVLTTATGNPQVLQLRTDINALATEIATIYKGGTQPSEKEISAWENTIAADFSKSQFTGVSNEISKLLTSKITSTRYQYQSTMGQPYPQSIIDPDKRQALLDAGINIDSIANENVPGLPSLSSVFDSSSARSKYGY
jgi:LysM repeat protein